MALAFMSSAMACGALACAVACSRPLSGFRERRLWSEGWTPRQWVASRMGEGGMSALCDESAWERQGDRRQQAEGSWGGGYVRVGRAGNGGGTGCRIRGGVTGLCGKGARGGLGVGGAVCGLRLVCIRADNGLMTGRAGSHGGRGVASRGVSGRCVPEDMTRGPGRWRGGRQGAAGGMTRGA